MSAASLKCPKCGLTLPQDAAQCPSCLPDVVFPQIAGYRIDRLIGIGGMGCVYLAEDLTLGRRVAIKVVSEEYLMQPLARERFLREARTMATVEHPHIVRVYNFGEVGGRPYMIMELIEGESLADRIANSGPMPHEQAIAVLCQVIEALEAAWEKQIVHRDIKPSNIMLNRKDHVWVADFGLAKPLDAGNPSLTQEEKVVCTPNYTSPEQALGQPLDFRSDIYSLGIVFYEMLAGRRPFEGSTPIAVMSQHLNVPLPSISVARPGVPGTVGNLLQWMTRKNPADRPTSYDQLLRKVESVLPGGQATVDLSSQRPLRSRNFRRAVLLSLLFILALAVAGTLLFWKKTEPPVPSDVSIFVLPIKAGADEQSRRLADMITGEIVSRLGTSGKMEILYVPEASSGREREAIEKVKSIRTVRYLVDGNLFVHENDLRISAQVIDDANSSVLWSDSLTGQVDDFYSIAARVSSAVASVAGVYLTTADITFPGRPVFDWYARAVMINHRRDASRIPESVALLKNCIKEAPGFSPAYVALSEALWNYQNLGIDDDPRYIKEAKDYVLRALKLDPRSADAHMMLSRISKNQYDEATARSEIRRAIELKPTGSEWLYLWKSALDFDDGRVEEAYEDLRRAREINPLNHLVLLNFIMLKAMTGDAEAVHRAANEISSLYSPEIFLVEARGWDLYASGDRKGALEWMKDAYTKERHPLNALVAFQFALDYGDYVASVGFAQDFLASNRYQIEAYWMLCLAHRLSGDSQSAMEEARKARVNAAVLDRVFSTPKLKIMMAYFDVVAGTYKGSWEDVAKIDVQGCDSIGRYLKQAALAYLGDPAAAKNLSLPYSQTFWFNRLAPREKQFFPPDR
jgi:TolB-like protein